MSREDLREQFDLRILNRRSIRCTHCRKLLTFPYGVNIFGTDQEKAFGIAIKESGIGFIEGNYPRRDMDKSGISHDMGVDDRVESFHYQMICKACLKQIFKNLATYNPVQQINWFIAIVAFLAMGLAIAGLLR